MSNKDNCFASKYGFDASVKNVFAYMLIQSAFKNKLLDFIQYFIISCIHINIEPERIVKENHIGRFVDASS